jgi:hypothetical protein
MADGMTVEDAQRAASEVASQFRVFECDQCAAAIVKRLGRIVPMTFERLRTGDGSDVIGIVPDGIQVSRNKTHIGVRIGDRIYDKLHHQGIPENEWAGRFMTMTPARLVRESRPVRDFFGKVFLRKRFRRWSSGS